MHVSDCCSFSDVNISQGSVETCVRSGGLLMAAESVGERVLKIGQHLMKLQFLCAQSSVSVRSHRPFPRHGTCCLKFFFRAVAHPAKFT